MVVAVSVVDLERSEREDSASYPESCLGGFGGGFVDVFSSSVGPLLVGLPDASSCLASLLSLRSRVRLAERV